MTIKRLLGIFPLLVLLLGGPARAVEVAGLYSAELEVGQVTAEPTEQQTHEGLAQVLVKLSGRRDVASSQGYQRIMAQAPMLLSQYRFRPRAEGALLELVYDGPTLDRMLEEAGIRGPGGQRPAVLLWLVVNGNGYHDYASPDDPALQALAREARKRGLPLQQPLLDLEDQVALPPDDLWSLPESRVREASARYRPDAILVGRVSPEGAAVTSQFRLLANGDSETLAPGGSLAEQMTAVIDGAADKLFLRGAPRQVFSYQPRGLVLDIEGVESQRTYLQLVSLLRRTEGVASVFPERFSQGHLQLRLQLETSVGGLQETLRLEPRLRELPQAGSAQPGETGLLKYRWDDVGETAQ